MWCQGSLEKEVFQDNGSKISCIMCSSESQNMTTENLTLARCSSVVILTDYRSFGGVIKFCQDELKEQEAMKYKEQVQITLGILLVKGACD